MKNTLLLLLIQTALISGGFVFVSVQANRKIVRLEAELKSANQGLERMGDGLTEATAWFARAVQENTASVADLRTKVDGIADTASDLNLRSGLDELQLQSELDDLRSTLDEMNHQIGSIHDAVGDRYIDYSSSNAGQLLKGIDDRLERIERKLRTNY